MIQTHSRRHYYSIEDTSVSWHYNNDTLHYFISDIRSNLSQDKASQLHIIIQF
jgi:hypothetical protein